MLRLDPKNIFKIIITGILLLGITACTTPIDFHQFRNIKRNAEIGFKNSISSIRIDEIEFKDFEDELIAIYGSEQLFRELYIKKLSEKIVSQSPIDPHVFRIKKMQFSRLYDGYGIATTYTYCVISIEFEIQDRNGVVCWSGELNARSAHTDAPSLHPFRARLKHALENMESTIFAIVTGEPAQLP